MGTITHWSKVNIWCYNRGTAREHLLDQLFVSVVLVQIPKLLRLSWFLDILLFVLVSMVLIPNFNLCWSEVCDSRQLLSFNGWQVFLDSKSSLELEYLRSGEKHSSFCFGFCWFAFWSAFSGNSRVAFGWNVEYQFAFSLWKYELDVVRDFQ